MHGCTKTSLLRLLLQIRNHEFHFITFDTHAIAYIVLFDAAGKISSKFEIIHNLISIMHEVLVAYARVH